MDPPREHLLAGAALASDQYCRVQPRHLLDESHHRAHRHARAHHELLVLRLHLRGERLDAIAQVLPLARVAHQRAQRVVVELLRDVVVRAELHGLDGRLDIGDGRDHDHFDLVALFAHLPQQLQAADARQAYVEQHQVHAVLPQPRQAVLGRRHGHHAVVALENRRERVSHPLIVIDDQDGLLRRGHQSGNLTGSTGVPESAGPDP